MHQYKDTTHSPNTLETLKNGQIDTSTKVTFSDVIKSILLAVLMIGLLLLISSYHQAHPKNSLLLVAGMGQNNATTKLKAVKPNRHSLAIFVPKINPTTNRTIATGTNTPHILYISKNGYISAMGGFIDRIKNHCGNKSSRLSAVVTTRPPLNGLGVNLTKLKGGHYHA